MNLVGIKMEMLKGTGIRNIKLETIRKLCGSKIVKNR